MRTNGLFDIFKGEMQPTQLIFLGMPVKFFVDSVKSLITQKLPCTADEATIKDDILSEAVQRQQPSLCRI